MEIRKIGKEELGLIKKFYEEKIEEYCEYDSYHFEWMLENIDNIKDNFLVILKNNKVFDLIKKENLSSDNYSLSIHIPYFYNDPTKEELELISKENVIIALSDYYCFDFEEAGYKYLGFKSSFSEEHEYQFGSYSFIVPNTFEDEQIISKYFEDKYFHPTKEIHFKIFEKDDFLAHLLKYETIFFQIPTWKRNSRCIAGFQYCSLEDLSIWDNGKKFLVAMNESEEVVGVIKWGQYGHSEKDIHLGLSYIDVRIDSRQQGIATKMIKHFATIIKDNELPFILSDESDMGKKCNMALKFKTFIKEQNPNMSVMTTRESYQL